MLAKKPDAAVHQESTEDIRDPLKSLDESDTNNDKDGPHDQRAHDSPEQYFVLVFGSDAKESKNQNEDKEIIDAKRQFNDVTSNELHCGRVPVARINQHRECAGEPNPNQAPDQGLAKINRMAAPLQKSEVERQHAQHEKIEENPKKELVQLSLRTPARPRISIRSSPFSLLPHLPHAKGFHQIIQVRLVHGLFDLRVTQPRTDSFRSIGDAESKSGRLGDMFLQLWQIDLIEGVRHGVIVDQVIRFLLFCHESRHAFKHEIEMVGAPFRSGQQRGRIKLLQRRNQIVGCIDDVLASTDREARDFPRARIENNYRRGLVQLSPMSNGVSVRSEQTLFFS